MPTGSAVEISCTYHLEQRHLRVQGCADDTVPTVHWEFLGSVTGIVQERLRELDDWWKRETLKENPSRTVIVPFSRNRKDLGGFATCRSTVIALAHPAQLHI